MKLDFEVKSFRDKASGSLLGFMDVYIPQLEWTLKGCSLFAKGSHQWISIPSRPYQGPDGKTMYAPLIEMSKEMRDEFSKACLVALEKFRATPPLEDVPF